MGEKRYYWLKFKEDFFTSKRIKKLRNLGADYLIIYLKMQLKALKTDGVLRITGLEKEIADEIALDIDEDTDKVQVTLSYLQACGLIETNEDTIFLPYVAINTGSETAAAQRGRDFRARMTDEQKAKERERARIGMKKIREERQITNELQTSYERVTNVEKEIEKDIDKENKKEKVSPERRKELCSLFENLYQRYHTLHKNSSGKGDARDIYIDYCTKGYKGKKLTPEQIEEYISNYVEENMQLKEKQGWAPSWKNIDTLMRHITDYKGDENDNG